MKTLTWFYECECGNSDSAYADAKSEAPRACSECGSRVSPKFQSLERKFQRYLESVGA